MSEHTDVAAYALGLLDPQDQRMFESHLATCPACGAELAELSDMRELLTGIEPVEDLAAEPDQAQFADLMLRTSAARRARARWQRALALAASVVVLAGGVGIGLAVSSRPATIAGKTFSATDPRTGVAATVGLVGKAWGTAVTLDLSRIHGPLECQLIAVSRTGQQSVVMGWFVTKAGDGVPGHPAHLIIQGSTPLQLADLTKVEVTVVHGGTLLTISV